MFAKYDVNNNGSLELEEAKKFLQEVLNGRGHRRKEVSDGDVQQFIESVDSNRNGKIEKEELY